MPYSPSSANTATSKTPYPRVTTKTGSTPYPKMGFQLNGVENVGTAVSSNDTTTIVNRTRNLRSHGEYYALDNGDIYFVNTRGQIGRINGTDIKLLEKSRNYFSWGGSVLCNADIEHEAFYESSFGDILDGASTHKILIRHCVWDDGPYKNYQPFQTSQCSPGDLIRPFKDNIIGFQTSENTCTIFKDGTPIYRGEFDGRRFPVEFNWKDWSFAGDPKIPNLNGGGITRGQAFIPELDAQGKIKWTMPKHSAIVVGGPLDIDNNETVNPEHLPSPIPLLHKIPTWLIWRHWFYPHPLSIVKHGLFTNPYEHPGYIATHYIKYRSYRWISCSCDEVCAQNCPVPKYEDEYFIGMKGGGSKPNVDENAVVIEDELVTIAANCINNNVAQGASTNACPPCPPTGDYIQPPCTIQRPLYKIEPLVTYYDFPPEFPFKSQIQGFAIGDVIYNKYSTEIAGFKICTKQPLFSSCKESRYIGKGELPKHFPFDWSLIEELGYTSDTVFNSNWYIEAEKTTGDRLKWWQKYIPTYFLYQSKPLSAFVVSIPTSHDEGGSYANYVDWEVDYSGDKTLQIRAIGGAQLNDYIPPWLSFSRYTKIPTSVPGIYQPQDRYTFDIKPAEGASSILVRLNTTPSVDNGLFDPQPSIKDLLEKENDVYTSFLTSWNTAILSHPIGTDHYGSIALRLRNAQRNAVATISESLFTDVENSKPYLSTVTANLQIAIQSFLNSVITQAFTTTEPAFQQVNSGTLTGSEYQLKLNAEIFSGLAQSSSSITSAINSYINTALTDNSDGFQARYNRTIKILARAHFQEVPSSFDPFWILSPFKDLSVDNVVGSYTFTELFRKKLLDSLETDITDFVSTWNTEHASLQITENEITLLINEWFDTTFIPSLEWHVSEPQPQYAADIAAKYLSPYSYSPVFSTPTIIPRPFSITIPSIIPLLFSPTYTLYTQFARERLGQELIPQLFNHFKSDIKIGISQSIQEKYKESELILERKKMIGIDSNSDDTAIKCCQKYFTGILSEVYLNAVNQLS